MAARLAAATVRLVAVVGHDFPDRYLALLRERGVDLAGLQVDAARKTFAWGGRYGTDPNQRTTLFTDLNVLATFDPKVPRTYRDSRILCLGNLDPRLQLQVMDQVPDCEFTVCDTMNYWITNTPSPLHQVLRRVDCLIINDEEARLITGRHNLFLAAKEIRALGPRILVIKKGEHGAILQTATTLFVTPAYPTPAVKDPTGAGDAFLGGFCGQLASEPAADDAALRRAVLFGTVVASFAVQELGTTRLEALTRADVAGRLDRFRQAAAWPAEAPSP